MADKKKKVPETREEAVTGKRPASEPKPLDKNSREYHVKYPNDKGD
jgi:hypothetical protein